MRQNRELQAGPTLRTPQVLDRLFVDGLERQAAAGQPLVADLIARMRADRGLGQAAADLGLSRHKARRALDRFVLTVGGK
jgi:DNA-binding phage protein